jgi:hypothetical protein
VYLTPSPETASHYASVNARGEVDSASTGSVYPVYADIKTPLDLRPLGTKTTLEEFNLFLEESGIDYQFRPTHYWQNNKNSVWLYFSKANQPYTDSFFTKVSRDHDSIILYDDSSTYGDPSGLTYIVFDSAQLVPAFSAKAPLTEAQKQVLDTSWLKRLREESYIILKDVDQVRDYLDVEAFASLCYRFSKNFEDLFFEQFLNRDLKYGFGLSEDEVEGVDSWLREPAWQFISEMRPSIRFADEYYSEERALADFQRNSRTWVNRARRKAQAFWRTVKEGIEVGIIPSTGFSVRTPEAETMEIEGFQVTVKDFSVGKGGRDEQKMNIIKEGLRRYRVGASERMPSMLKKQLPIVLEFDPAIDRLGTYKNRYIVLWASGVDSPQTVASTLAHEMGHHLYKFLSGDAQATWYMTIRGDFGEINLQDLLEAWPGETWIHEFPRVMADSDPVLGIQVGALAYTHNYAHLNTKADFQKLLDSGVTTIDVPKTPITAYANKNAEEAFCETLGLLVAYGPRSLHERVRYWLNFIL